MKSILFAAAIALTLAEGVAQNVGINTNTPREALDIRGNLIVQSAYTKSVASPAPDQTYVMQNSTITYPNPADSIYKVYDPAGPSGQYSNSLFSDVRINGGTGWEIRVDSVNLGTGDSLWIKDANTDQILVRAGTGSSWPNTQTLNGVPLSISFSSNADGQNGTGFVVVVRRLYSVLPAKAINNVFGNGFYIDLATGVTRGGQIDANSKGDYSTAFGRSSAGGSHSFAAGGAFVTGNYAAAFGQGTASGAGSFAAGASNAIGAYSTALGNATASGQYAGSIGSSSASGLNSFAAGKSIASNELSTALGESNTSGWWGFAAGKSTTTAAKAAALCESTASGAFSFAAGNSSASGTAATALGWADASAYYAVAIGTNAVASGSSSVAIGYRASTGGRTGSVCIGASISSPLNPAVQNINNNEFMVYADYYRFWTGTNGTSVYLNPGANAWLGTSDFRKKENFEPTDGDEVLEKLSNIDFGSWNYIGQDPDQYRHYGIMAQDFYNAFGKDSYGTIGCDTLVNPLDMMGIAYSAIKALEVRTRDLDEQKKEIALLKEQNTMLLQRLENLEHRRKNR